MDVRFYLAAGILTAAAASDIRTEKIDNRWILAGIAAGAVLSLAGAWPLGFSRMAAGMLLSAALLLPVFLIQGLGAGDIKLFMLIGWYYGPDTGVVGSAVLYSHGFSHKADRSLYGWSNGLPADSFCSCDSGCILQFCHTAKLFSRIDGTVRLLYAH